MKKITRLLMLLTLSSTTLITTACSANSSSLINQRFQDLKAILWNFSVEKKAQLLTQYQTAKLQFDAVLKANEQYLAKDAVQVDEKNNFEVSFNENIAPNKFVPIVVVDLDETFIDNTPEKIYDYFNNDSRYSDQNWHKWVINQSQFQKQIYPGVLDFVKHVWMKGGMVLFDSDRKMGDHNLWSDQATATRATLMNNGYPISFLDSYTWWMKGVTKYNDVNWEPLASKENRFNYLNDTTTKLKSRSMEELAIQNGWNDVGPNLQNLPIHIVMKVGDNIADFNDNFIKYNPQASLTLRDDYLENQDIRNLFGQVGREIWFTKDHDTYLQHYWKDESTPEIDQLFLNKRYVSKIKGHDGIPWKNTLLQIGGNATYGSWIDSLENQYGSGITNLEKALFDYFKEYQKAFN